MGESSIVEPTSHNVLVHVHDIPMDGLRAPGDTDTLGKVDGAVQIISGSLAIGMFTAPPPINLACGVLAAVGSLISIGINAFGGKSDPAAEKFKLLTQKLKELEEKIIARFDEMKVFISENKFSMEVIRGVATLKKFMMEVFESSIMNTASDHKLAIENFRKACDLTPPLTIAYTISSLLAQKTTNPLAMSIEKSHKDKEKALEYWENVIRTLIWDLVLIECIAAGLFKNKNLFDCERIIEESMEVDDILEEIEKIYNVGPWAEFKKKFPSFAEGLIWHGTDKRDRMILVQNELKLKCPRDSFYICIFDSGEFEKDYYYHIGTPHNIVEVRNLASREHGNRKFSIFVYRSYKGTRIAQSEYERLVKKMNKNPKYDNKKSSKELVDLMKKDVRSDGLIAVLSYSKNSLIDFVKCPEYAKGPGNFRMTWLGDHKDWKRIDWIVGFP
ncbi:hypothetical protein CAEBREN_11849 [Caenorhabditis brenneri]|uniref:Uncharacterized protein n=1 Tax=Caenorhabditis brenneri TaxID=135651 RepID=G0NXE7_CAEBE|nr:hypothetical protein CAEBREN_11849 [Caenorhabditis brenneri]